MRVRIVVFSIILILTIAAAIIAYREFVVQVPCGNDLFADDNGSFESGNFVPNANGGMDLLNGANDLTDWTITVSPTSNNPIAWYSDANRFNVKAQNGHKFVTLAGDGNPLQEPYPLLNRVGIPVQQGRYRLKIYLGQDPSNGFPGHVSADVGISGAATLHHTFATNATGPTWQEQTLDFNVPANGAIDIAFGATAGQSKLPVRYVGLDNISLRRLEPVFRCSQ
jgi:hypothetical protein